MSSKTSEVNNSSSNKNLEIEDQDFILIREYNSGSEVAFEKLVRLHKDKVRNLIISRARIPTCA